MFKGFGKSVENEIQQLIGKGSVFLRIAEHDAQIQSVKVKQSLVADSNKVTAAILDDIEKVTVKLSAERDVIEARLIALIKAL